jgi:hypothetical protein
MLQLPHGRLSVSRVSCLATGYSGLFPKKAIGSEMKQHFGEATSDSCLGRDTFYQAALFETDRAQDAGAHRSGGQDNWRSRQTAFVVIGDHLDEKLVLDPL